MQILLSQELIKTLINALTSCHNENTKDEIALAIELTLDFGRFSRPSDIEILSKFILNQVAPLNLRVTKIAYKLLNLLRFQANDNDDGLQRVVKLCFDTMIHMHDTLNLLSASDSNESAQHVIVLMRICSNSVAVDPLVGDFIIFNWFQSQNRSMASFFNHFIEQISLNGCSAVEILWFIGNLLRSQVNNESTKKYLECDDFFKKFNSNNSS